MARPRKDKDDLAVRKEIYAAPADWADIATAARNAGLSVSQYLVALHRMGTVLAPAPVPELPLAAARLQAEVEALAAITMQMPAAPILLTRLIRIEEALTALGREAAA